MKFDEIKDEYVAGKIGSKEYAQKMFAEYEKLLQYKNLIKDSCISKITINEEDVIFTATNRDVKKNPYPIDMIIYENDAAAVPATLLSFEKGYEPEELSIVNILCSYINDNAVFFDVGANLGWYTLNILKQYPNIKSYAFEPIKETYFKMQKNIKINQITNCNLYNFGLWDNNQQTSFFYDIEASGASSIVDIRERNSTVKVCGEVRRMDDFIVEENINRLDFIKCDVEGAELFVFKGGIESIQKYKPIIFSEMLRKWSQKFNYHPNDIIHLLEETDYHCYILAENNKLKRFGYVDEETIETNYFFLHPQKHQRIINDLCIK